MSFDKESVKACCKSWLSWAMENFKGLFLLGLGVFLLVYTYRIFLYFVLFVFGTVATYIGLRELKFTFITGFLDMICEKIHALWCRCKQS